MKGALVVFFIVAFYAPFISAHSTTSGCFGPFCPDASNPISIEDTKTPCNETGKYSRDPSNCHNFFVCSVNGTLAKLSCPKEYGYQEQWALCVPEGSINACSLVSCPPYIFDGVLPDPTDCTAFYRCIYGFAYREKCRRHATFVPEAGKCKRYKVGQEPPCVQAPTTTPATPTTTAPTTPQTGVPNATAPAY